MSPVGSSPPETPEDLRRRLHEAEETLAAIRAGEVDAVVVDGPDEQRVYTLESQDQPFRIFVDHMQEGALTVTGAHTIVYCNRHFAELIGRPAERVMGSSLDAFLAPAFAPALGPLLAAARRGSLHAEGVLVAADGRNVPVRLSIHALPPRDLSTFGMVVTDLTEQRRAQRLDAARLAAEEANAARDRFLATLSHELRTPLNAVLGWSQLLARQQSLSEQVRQGLAVIERNARAQSKLIDDLLDVSRIVTGKLRLEPRPVDIADVLRTAAASVEPHAESEGITLRTIASESATVAGDPDRLQQVIANLVSNAIQHTEKGGHVALTLRRSGPWAEIAVRDTGRGIPPESLPRLFELFEQGEGEGTRRRGGLGLGLAIVKQITEMHGGEVHAWSEGEGRGSTFTVRLPLQSPLPAPGTSQQPRADDLAGLRVLIVEDEPDARELFRSIVESRGGTSLLAGSVAEALALLDCEHVDVFVSDIGLPDGDGCDLMRQIRAGGRTARELPAIAVTAFAGIEHGRRALSAGFQVHLSKPLDHDELCMVLANLGRAGS